MTVNLRRKTTLEGCAAQSATDLPLAASLVLPLTNLPN